MTVSTPPIQLTFYLIPVPDNQPVEYMAVSEESELSECRPPPVKSYSRKKEHSIVASGELFFYVV